MVLAVKWEWDDYSQRGLRSGMIIVDPGSGGRGQECRCAAGSTENELKLDQS